jgi:hypothetical protein
VFSIKYTAGDFWRMLPFNPTLGIGKHRQIVEVQCQSEYYGKGAHPYYVGDGVINGWEESSKIMEPGRMKSLSDLVRNPNFAGVWTWSRGGSWGGPYITNELWCKLNAYVVARYAQNPQHSEEEIFNQFAIEELHLNRQDVARFRQLNLLSAAGVLRGHCSLLDPVNRIWARDDTMAAPELGDFVKDGLVPEALAEKSESVAMWQKIEQLARQIHFADKQTQDFVETSATYGQIKFAIFEEAWTVLLCGQTGAATKNYDCDKIQKAIAAYDQLWKEWHALKDSRPSCATLYTESAPHGKPGVGVAMERYRRLCEEQK